MKTTLVLVISLLLSVSLYCQQPAKVQRDTIVVPTDPVDSLVQQKNWVIREPLSAQEQQRRADNRAEVEDMKTRFRQFHQEEEQLREADEVLQEEGDYLWSEAKTGGQLQSKGTNPEPSAKTPGTEDLRMEIGRNLQEGRRMDVPPQPVRPTYTETPIPAEYEQPAPIPTQQNWENNIRTALRQEQTDGTGNQWQAKVGATPGALINPQNGMPLQAGQTIVLTNVLFAEMSAALSPSTQDVLHQWAKILNANPDLIIQVRAHTHSGIPTFEAQQLTNQRAEAVVLFWQQQGIPTRQLSYRGYGRLSPLVSSADPQAQQKNERIELVILEMP